MQHNALKPKVFISYSSLDEDRAKRVGTFLVNAGYDVWMAPNKNNCKRSTRYCFHQGRGNILTGFRVLCQADFCQKAVNEY